MNKILKTNHTDNSIFLSQLPLHLQKILTIWNKLVYVGWVETTFNNLDKTLLKLVSISKKNNFNDLYYQTLDIHRIFTDIINDKRTPSIYEFKNIDSKIKSLCAQNTFNLPDTTQHHNSVNSNKIAILHINSTEKKSQKLFSQKPRSKIVQCSSIDSLIKIDNTHNLDAILVYLEDKHVYEKTLTQIHRTQMNCKTIIAISPRTDAHIRLQAIRLKCLDYLQLPINENQLSAIIESNQIVNEQITTVGLFKNSKHIESLSNLMAPQNITLINSVTPLDIIHDVSKNQAHVIVLFDVDERIIIELLNLLQSHPNTCLLPIIYATSDDNCKIQKQLNENAVHYIPNCLDTFENLINKTYALGKHLMHQMQHNKINDSIESTLLSTEEFINHFQYIYAHIEKDETRVKHYFFNIQISYLTNNKPIEHLGFSQIHKLSNITTGVIENSKLINDTICTHGNFNYFLIKESIETSHAEDEMNHFSKVITDIELATKPSEITVQVNTVGILIERTHSLDALIEFTSSVINNRTEDSAPVRIMNFSNTPNIYPIEPIKNKTQQEVKRNREEQSNKADIITAFQNDGVFMKYQPIVDVQKNLAVFEVYARLCDHNNVCFDPSVFFPILIQQNLAHEFNRRIIEKTLTELSSHNNISQEADFILKLLPSNDPKEDILNKIIPWFSTQLLGHRLLGKNRIIFELSEPWVIKHFEQAKMFTDKVKQLDCSICIDHSDVSAASLKIAQILKPSYIKIDPSLKHIIIEQSKIETINILQQLSNSSSHLVASCVETSEEYSALWDKGIRYFQGYYVQQPLDQPEFIKTN
ncbi:MAG: EAL domain-containing protein [Saccharospirillaceae bacterium]|nr:EAL domain-containing protein [Pseudomonadales bacterium]NRB78072.1 EAL domain-containing protein [Saccharospirillaceae bacterium]